MNAAAIDHALSQLRGSLNRRALSAAALSAAIALGVVRSPLDGAARKRRKKRKHKKRKQPIARNAFGCVDVGMRCRGDSANCCSGVCEGNAPQKGKQDTSRCVAHDVGGCVAAADFCTGISPVCGNGGACFRTTGNASFCGGKGICATCRRDVDCEADFGPGAACVVCSSACPDTGGTSCRPAAA